MKKVTRRGGGLFPILLALFAIGISFLCSCNVTRTITTTQSHMKNGDTISVMTTRSSETYSAKKDL